jgi:alpha-mannosidase
MKTLRIRFALAVGAACLLWPCDGGAQQAPRPGCQGYVEKWNGIAREEFRDWRYHQAGDFAGELPSLDDSAWPVTQKDTAWRSTTIWTRRWYTVPAERGGYSYRGARLVLSLRGSWAMTEYVTVFVNGQHRAAGLEIEPLMLTENAQPGERFHIAIRLQHAGGQFWPLAATVELAGVDGRPDARGVLTECATAELLHEASGADASREAAIAKARGAVDWPALERGEQQRFDASLAAARAALEPLRGWLHSFSVTAAGNAHIDMAWLWPWTETVEVVRNTFASVLKLMQEFPALHFSHGAVQTYQWMEEKYPELFAQVQRRVKEGRWELVGGMWVEPDLNMPDGESLTRQLLIGKRYIQDKFGVDVRVGFNPDSFGYNWQLPQIYKRAGIDYFVTQKIYWNDTTKFPHKLFWWEAPDGSRLLTFFPHDYVNQMDSMRIARDLATTRKISGLGNMLHLYGVGDHGGGPTRQMLRTGAPWTRSEALYPTTRYGTVLGFFEQVQPLAAKGAVPVWKDELYLEYHRGVFTTQARTKKNNRRNETLVLNAEKFASFASLFGAEYPQAVLDETWKKVLFNQFHDILPGSSIPPVYVDADRDHDAVRLLAGQALQDALGEIAAQVDTRGPGVPIVVFNPLGWPRSGVVEVAVTCNFDCTRFSIVGPANDEPALVANTVEHDAATSRLRVRFVAENVPALGYAVYRVVPEQTRIKIAVFAATADSLENHQMRVQVDPKSGCLTSVYDKRAKREALAQGACGNLLQAFHDKPKDWDAWNIDANFEEQMWELREAESVKLVESGPIRATIRVTKKFRNSTFVQDISLTAGSPRVEIRTKADWHEDHVLIKAAFPLAVRSDYATFEIPYGAIRRPTTRNTPEEKAKFEVPAIRWADLSDATGGLSVLNDSKYGYDAKGNVLRISLLRSPKWPDPQADMGKHEFTYALYPHAGAVGVDTVRQGYELNTPLVAVVTTAHPGPLPAWQSFVSIEPENVVLSALKKAEDGDAWIVRFYEIAGRETQVRLRMPRIVVHAQETNLLEQPEHELAAQGQEVTVPTKPYEIKTVRIELPAAQPLTPSFLHRRPCVDQ